MGGAKQWRDILLVEDSPSDAEMLRVAFREYGHLPCRIHSVRDGEAALAFLQRHGLYAGMPRPDLLILDIGLPKLGGWKVLKTPARPSYAGHATGRDANRGEDGSG